VSDEQPANAESSICRSLDSNLNATVESNGHPEKQDLERTLTEAGIQIDFKDEHCEKASAPILDREDRGSNKTSAREGLPLQTNSGRL
jgi:hypothetical protein